jgi:hypothetical protein
MTRRPGHGSQAVTFLVASLLALSACSDDDPESEATPTSSASATPTSGDSGSTTDAPADDPSEETAPAVPDRLPAGPLVNRLEVKVSPPRKDVVVGHSAAFTDRYVIAATATGMLRVIDRTTFTEVWSTKLRPQQGYGACVLPQPVRDAEYVSVFVGSDCERLMTFELATGRKVVDRVVDETSVTGYGRVGEETVWTGTSSINKVDGDGNTHQYADLEQLGITDDAIVSRAVVASSAVEGSDVVVLGVSDFETTGNFATTERLVGVHVAGDEPSVAFDLPLAQLGLPGGKPRDFQVLDQPGGLFLAQLRNGRWAFGTVDPDTGSAAGLTVVLPPISQGVPAILERFTGDAYAVSETVALMGLMADPSIGLTAHLARYDLDQGTETWRSLIPPTKGQPKTGVAMHVVTVGFAADAQHAYGVYFRGATQEDLFEVDLATGEQTGRWPKVDQEIETGRFYVDGDLVVGVSSGIHLRNGTELVIKQAG